MVLKLKPISLSNRGYILEWFIPAKFRQDLQQHALSQPLNLQSLWLENFIQTSLPTEKKKKVFEGAGLDNHDSNPRFYFTQ